MEEGDKTKKRKSSPLSKENLLYGTSSSSENEQKKFSPDRKSSNEKSPHRTSPKHLQEDESAKNQRKMSPSSRDKRVSFESKDEKVRKDSDKKDDTVEKEREDSLPPPDFEENYLIAQSDILRQASIEYDRRMQEHKVMLQRMRAEEHFDESTSQEFPDFETWMEEREKEESRKSSLEKEAEELRTNQETIKPYSIANLRDEVLIEVSVEGSFDSVDKPSEDDSQPQHIVVKVDVEPVPEDNDDDSDKTNNEDIQSIHEDNDEQVHILQENEKNNLLSREEEYKKRLRELDNQIRNLVLVENLKHVDEYLKNIDLKMELVKQDSMKEMRRSMERRDFERRRRSEEKTPVSVKTSAKQRRSLSFDEEILI